MSKRFSILLVALVIVSGLIGGAISGRILNTKSAIAYETNVLKVSELDVIDKDGRLVLTGTGITIYDSQDNKCVVLNKSGLQNANIVNEEEIDVSGKYYHVKECKSFNVDRGMSISLSGAERSDYKPCPLCDPLSKLTVLVTRTGECYHIGCKGKIPMSLKDARKQYRACKVCNPDSKVFVFISAEGEKSWGEIKDKE